MHTDSAGLRHTGSTAIRTHFIVVLVGSALTRIRDCLPHQKIEMAWIVGMGSPWKIARETALNDGLPAELTEAADAFSRRGDEARSINRN